MGCIGAFGDGVKKRHMALNHTVYHNDGSRNAVDIEVLSNNYQEVKFWKKQGFMKRKEEKI